MADTLRDGVRDIAQKARPSEVNPKLEEAMQNQPLLPHLVSMRVVLTAVAIGAVVALILYVLFSPMLAGLGLIVAFFAAWFGLAVRSHEKHGTAGRGQKAED
jgi:Flp pilus assembly protein TadB